MLMLRDLEAIHATLRQRVLHAEHYANHVDELTKELKAANAECRGLAMEVQAVKEQAWLEKRRTQQRTQRLIKRIDAVVGTRRGRTLGGAIRALIKVYREKT